VGLVGSKRAFAGDCWQNRGSYQKNKETFWGLVGNRETFSDWAESKVTFYLCSLVNMEMLLPEIVVNMGTSLGQYCLESREAPDHFQTENREASVPCRPQRENKVVLVHYHLLMAINVLEMSLTRPLMEKHARVKGHLEMVQND